MMPSSVLRTPKTARPARVLVSARRLSELKAAPEGVEIEAIEPVERTARALQATELALPNSPGEDGGKSAVKNRS